eukprot:TRINITY_DN3196_c0_g3_i1.p1 TRINITY_DN3196_c0_g3~~TRINITY_DN3196_c0_g3_i1.p1  ORF type:complete len:234 (-),score=35.08 TRINITY_DN3196_c0_g3_i1:61-762(-)
MTGLCVYHLLTGEACENVMDTLKCPPELKRALLQLWKSTRKPYGAIRKQLRDVVDAEDTFPDTLYRIFVALGAPNSDNPAQAHTATRSRLRRTRQRPQNDVDGEASTLSVWSKFLESPENASMFARDQARYCLFFENKDSTLKRRLPQPHSRVAQARETLENHPDLRDVFTSMISYAYQERPSMKALLETSFFEALMNPDLTAQDVMSAKFQEQSTVCMMFHKSIYKSELRDL